MLVSIRLGLEAISPEAAAVFIWPADHPAVSRGTIGLSPAARTPLAARAFLPVRRGHPALIGRDLVAESGRSRRGRSPSSLADRPRPCSRSPSRTRGCPEYRYSRGLPATHRVIGSSHRVIDLGPQSPITRSQIARSLDSRPILRISSVWSQNQ
jgi:hypothetical protein